MVLQAFSGLDFGHSSVELIYGTASQVQKVQVYNSIFHSPNLIAPLIST